MISTATNRLAITGQIPQGQCSLALHFQTRAVHEHHQARHKLRLALRQFLPVRAIHGDIAQSSRAVVLHICIRRVQ